MPVCEVAIGNPVARENERDMPPATQVGKETPDLLPGSRRIGCSKAGLLRHHRQDRGDPLTPTGVKKLLQRSTRRTLQPKGCQATAILRFRLLGPTSALG